MLRWTYSGSARSACRAYVTVPCRRPFPESISRPDPILALALISELGRDSIDISTLVNEYDEGITAHRQWFRERLLALHSTLSNDLPRWALSETDRKAVIEWRNANPIPVYRGSEPVGGEPKT